MGTELGSKTYRLLDPSRKKIVVSQDVHFDKEKQWSWNDTVGGKETKHDTFFELAPLTGNGNHSGAATESESENDEVEVLDEEDDEEEET